MGELHRHPVRAEEPLVPVQAGFDVGDGDGDVVYPGDAGSSMIAHVCSVAETMVQLVRSRGITVRASLSGRPPAAQTGRGEPRADATRRDPSGINRARLAVVRRSTVPRTTNESEHRPCPTIPRPLHLAVALDGTGWHPASWREPDARPTDLLSARYWTDLVVEAERGLLDFVTIEDALTPQYDDPSHADDRVDRVRGRLDAVLIASRVAPLTRHIGLVPTAVVTHTEPFHLSKAIATLDYVSSGRAGIRVQVTASPEAARHFGRRDVTQTSGADLLAEAADYVEVLRRLWDSWEDDAEIRDVASGRFVDRAKLHYIDFEGARFSVRGPSITPRPPQGQPIVAALGHGDPAYALIAASADVGFTTPHDASEVTAVVDAISSRRDAGLPPVRVFADLVVFLDDSVDAARARRHRLDDRAGGIHQ